MNTQTDNVDQVIFDDEGNSSAATREKMTDILTPGYQAEFDPLEADNVGAFVEDAMSEIDALESTDDLLDPESSADQE